LHIIVFVFFVTDCS